MPHAASATALEQAHKPISSICQLKGIFAGYEGEDILHDINLCIGRREIVAVMGANGAGKSTLLKVIAGFIIPSRGEVWFNNEDVTNLEPHERVQRGIAYVMQGSHVFTDLTVRENLQIGAMSIAQEVRDEEIDKALQLFPQLRRMDQVRAGLLSGGERQALALAIVGIRRAPLLMLDEPTAGLSEKLAEELLLSIYEMNKHWDTSILLVEHKVSEALKIADWVLVMENGRVAAQGPKEELRHDSLG